MVAIRVIRRGARGVQPPAPSFGVVGEIKPASSWTTWIREGGGGGRDPRARAAAQIGHFRSPGRQNPRFASPRTRPERPEKAGGMGGQSFSLPPPLPGPSRPLRGGRRGSCGGGSDPRPGPRPAPPPFGRIPFHPREAPLPPPPLAGFMQRTPGICRNSMRAGPRFRPRKGLSVREGELSRRWGTCALSGGGLREASSPLGPQPQMNRRARGRILPFRAGLRAGPPSGWPGWSYDVADVVHEGPRRR